MNASRSIGPTPAPAPDLRRQWNRNRLARDCDPDVLTLVEAHGQLRGVDAERSECLHTLRRAFVVAQFDAEYFVPLAKLQADEFQKIFEARPFVPASVAARSVDWPSVCTRANRKISLSKRSNSR